MSPAPGFAHQTICVRLVVLLDAAAPPQPRVLTAPFDVRLADDTGVQPDVLMARREAFSENELRAGAYVEVADVTAHDGWVARSPFEVRIVPAELLG